MDLIENCNRIKQNIQAAYTVLEESGIVFLDSPTSDDLSSAISELNTVNKERETSILNRSIVTYENDIVTLLSGYSFINCNKLKTISIPNVTDINTSVFRNCSSLYSVYCPKASYVGNYAFAQCPNLKEFTFDSLSIIGGYAFNECVLFDEIELPAVTKIEASAFKGCTNLSTIYLPGSDLCTLANTDVFDGTGITATSGYIYVPASMSEAYKAATNWSYFADRIFSIEEE